MRHVRTAHSDSSARRREAEGLAVIGVFALLYILFHLWTDPVYHFPEVADTFRFERQTWLDER